MPQSSNKNMYLIIAAAAVLVIALGYFFMNNTSSAGVSQAQAAPQAQAGSSQQAPVNENPTAPDFTLKNLDGEDVTLSSLKGKLIFVNFWATWCGPCRQEIPSFISLVDKYGKDGFTVLGIALDPREFEKVPGFANDMGINYPILYDNIGVSELYGGIRSIPTTFVIDREGKVLGQIVGSRPHDVFKEIITSNL